MLNHTITWVSGVFTVYRYQNIHFCRESRTPLVFTKGDATDHKKSVKVYTQSV